MLVLSRKKNESIVIRNDITVTVLNVRGDKVSLGIEAPDNVAVDRSEVRVAKNAAAAALASATPTTDTTSPPAKQDQDPESSQATA